MKIQLHNRLVLQQGNKKNLKLIIIALYTPIYTGTRIGPKKIVLSMNISKFSNNFFNIWTIFGRLAVFQKTNCFCRLLQSKIASNLYPSLPSRDPIINSLICPPYISYFLSFENLVLFEQNHVPS